MRTMVGVPAPFVILMRLMPWVWRKLKAVAHTLPYDAAVMSGFKVPRARLAASTAHARDVGRRPTPDSRMQPGPWRTRFLERAPGARGADTQRAGRADAGRGEVPDRVSGGLEAMRCVSSSCTRPTRTGRLARFQLRIDFRVGALIGDLAKADALRGGEGLRSSAQGVRLSGADGTRTIAKGPFIGATSCRPDSPFSGSIRSIALSSGRRNKQSPGRRRAGHQARDGTVGHRHHAEAVERHDRALHGAAKGVGSDRGRCRTSRCSRRASFRA